MIRSSVRSAGLALLLTMNGCGDLSSSGYGGKSPSLNVAEAALQGGAGQIALQVSEGILRGSPNSIRALEVKGDALSLLGDYDQAAAVFQALLVNDPGSIRANTGLGRIKLSKDPAAAETMFLTVLKRDPKDLTALNNLGIARDLEGRHGDAQTAYRQALSVNPDLESAKVNMALSLAMSGQGPAAIELLRTAASEPGAGDNIKHDYAVVLAMAGHRGEAEQVLSQSLPSDEAGQVLDSVTGVHPRIARENTPADEAGVSRIAALRQNRDGDDVPPDVVQVPEVPAHPVRAERTASISLAAMTAPPPMVVRPQPVLDPDSGPPVLQPVNPAAAAMTYQRALSSPVETPAPPTAAAEDPTMVTMPRAPVRVASAEPAQLALPEAPPPPPVLAPAPLPPSYRPVIQAAAAKPAPEPVPAPVADAPVMASLAPSQTAATVEPPAQVQERSAAGLSAAVQFAATASEETAHAFWGELVSRFPDVLGQREPTVIRYERDGTVFWRLRTEGFDSLADAQSLCARMRAGGQDCFVPRS